MEALKAKVERREKLSVFKHDIDDQVHEKHTIEEQKRQKVRRVQQHAGRVTPRLLCLTVCTMHHMQEREFAESQARQQAEWKREQQQQKEAAAKRKERYVIEAVRWR